jgi:hypothetical protein
MSNRSRLLQLLAELDQQLAEARDTSIETQFSAYDSTERAEIIDGLRAAVVNVEWQLERDPAESTRG